MVSARNIIKFLATNKETQVKVFVGEAEVEQLVSAFIFTSQGSQGQGMGMGLYDSSTVEREVWGRADRHFMDNYAYGSISSDGSTKSEKIIKDVTEVTTSYTYYPPTGLLSAAKFTEPALTLMEKASGENSALAGLAEVMPIEFLVSVVFYRGLTMQATTERDTEGRINHPMIAVTPSRIPKTINEQALQ
ncbi:hypothetical protein HOY82DRAFT_617713 [Tuber indicum]|nr:hypothetical protein HOY82DRAFT_617713 [Tuber indicum]